MPLNAFLSNSNSNQYFKITMGNTLEHYTDKIDGLYTEDGTDDGSNEESRPPRSSSNSNSSQHRPLEDMSLHFSSPSPTNRRRTNRRDARVIFLSHRKIGNDGLEKLVDTIMRAYERKVNSTATTEEVLTSMFESMYTSRPSQDIAAKLHLCSTSISSLAPLTKLMPSPYCATEVLDVSRNELGDDAMVEWCQGIVVNTRKQNNLFRNHHTPPVTIRLSQLILRECGVRNKGCKALAEMMMTPLSDTTTPILAITTLDLSKNDIDEEGLMALSEALGWKGCTLEDLDLSRCNINQHNKGVESLARSLLQRSKNQEAASSSNPMAFSSPRLGLIRGLVTLKLSGNQLCPNSINALAECLNGCKHDDNSSDYYFPSLKSLFLNDTNLNANSAKKLAHALKLNTVIVTLSLRDNYGIGDEGAIAFAESLTTNSTLCQLLLGRCNDITSRGVEALLKSVYDEGDTTASPVKGDTLTSLASSNHILCDFGFGSSKLKSDDIGRDLLAKMERVLRINNVAKSSALSHRRNESIEVFAATRKIAYFLKRKSEHSMPHFLALLDSESVDTQNSFMTSVAFPFALRNLDISSAFEMARGQPEVCEATNEKKQDTDSR